MDKSREVIIVFTENTLKSPWYENEKENAYATFVERGRRPKVIKLGALPNYFENDTARTILQNNYLE